MLKYGLIVSGLLLAGSACAQPPKEPPKVDPNDPLDALLIRWEKTMAATESFLAKNCMRTERDKTGTKVYEGEIRFLKPGYFGLKMVQTKNPKIFEMLICTGDKLYEYRPQSKRLVIHEWNADKSGARHGIQQLLLGMTAVRIKRQFETKLIPSDAPGNPNFVTIQLQPRFAEDKQAFSQAQVVLWSKTMLPRRVTIEQANGSQIIWDLPNVDVETKLRPSDFTPPKAPSDWDTQTAPRAQPGRP
jgi:TIGR03009 family protein